MSVKLPTLVKTGSKFVSLYTCLPPGVRRAFEFMLKWTVEKLPLICLQ